MTPLPSQPLMPYSQNFAAKAGVPPIPPMPPHGSAPPMPAGPPPMPIGPQPLTPQSPGMAAVMPAAQPQAQPAPPPPQPQFVPQEDGTIAVTFPSPSGSGASLVSQIFPKPKLPAAFKQAAPPQ